MKRSALIETAFTNSLWRQRPAGCQSVTYPQQSGRFSAGHRAGGVLGWVMDFRRPWHNWQRGWHCLLFAGPVPGWNRLQFSARFRLTLLATVSLVAEQRARWLLWSMLAAMLLARTVAWRHDLSGWLRDAWLSLPLLVFAPWLVLHHRRELVARLRAKMRSERGGQGVSCERDHRQGSDR